MTAWLDKLVRFLLVPMPCCGRRIWGDREKRFHHWLICIGALPPGEERNS